MLTQQINGSPEITPGRADLWIENQFEKLKHIHSSNHGNETVDQMKIKSDRKISVDLHQLP